MLMSIRGRLRVLEVKIMCLKIYYVHSKGLPFGILSLVYYYVHSGAYPAEVPGFESRRARWCRLAYVRGRVFCALSDVRSVGFLDVKGCVNHVFMLKNACGRHGKSPCFRLGGF